MRELVPPSDDHDSEHARLLTRKADAFDRLMLSIPTVRNPTGDPETVERMLEILDDPLPGSADTT